jgi:hypothetical protein
VERTIRYRLHVYWADQLDTDYRVWGLNNENENFVWELDTDIVWRVD